MKSLVYISLSGDRLLWDKESKMDDVVISVFGSTIILLDAEKANRIGIVDLRIDDFRDDVILVSDINKNGYGYVSGQLVLAHDPNESRRVVVIIDTVDDDEITGYKIGFNDPKDWKPVKIKFYNTAGLLIE